MTLDEAIEALRESIHRDNGTWENTRRTLVAAFDVVAASSRERADRWKCACGKEAIRTDNKIKCRDCLKAMQCEPWCGTQQRPCPLVRTCYGDDRACLCSQECQDAVRPVNPKETP